MLDIRNANVGEVTIEYSLTGPVNRPVIAFAHGLGGNLSQYLHQREYFTEHYRVLLFSLRGHGGSSYPKPATRESFSIAAMAKDVVSLLDWLDIPAVHWVGNSMGGLVGYQMLKDTPERLLSLATFGITAELRHSSAFVKMLTLTKDVIIKLKGYEGFCRMAGTISSKSPDTQGKVMEMAQTAAPIAIKNGHMNVANVNHLEVLSKAKIPILLIKCEYDRAINKALGSTLRILRKAETAEVIEMPEVGHYANLDRPESFNNTLDEWYKTRV